MIIVGANKGNTVHGKVLRDGGLAVVRDGIVEMVLSEERISRKLRAGGFDAAQEELRNCSGLGPSEIDVVAMSTYCETQEAAARGHPFVDHRNIMTVNHHESHAWGAFATSGFHEALVAVVDGGGNILSQNDNPNWWEERREQHSYFVATESGLELVGRDFDSPYEVGFGELFRAAAYFLGWPSSRFSANVMALAALGNPKRISRKRFIEHGGDRLICPARYSPSLPGEMLHQIAREMGFVLGEPRGENGTKDELGRDHWDLAAYVQWNTEQALLERLRSLRRQTGMKSLCLAGGYALNCVVNGRIAESGIFETVYVSPAPSDQGQCLGNAVVAWHRIRGSRPAPISRSRDSYLGSPQSSNVHSEQLTEILKQHELDSAIIVEPMQLASAVAHVLAGGGAVCTFQDRSEFGARALGNRSILMRSDSRRTAAMAAEIKGREWFRPFAPVVLNEARAGLFRHGVESPFMSFALTTDIGARKVLSGTRSARGTARVQHVGGDCFVGAVLGEMWQKYGLPSCLNTSFNLRGQPIVETLSDAVEAFGGMPINVLAAGRFLVFKTLPPSVFGTATMSTHPVKSVSVRSSQSTDEMPDQPNTLAAVRWLRDRTGQMVVIRSGFSLFGDYLEWLRQGRKTTTLRWRKGAVEWPSSNRMPIWSSSDSNRDPSRNVEPTEWAHIDGAVYLRFCDLTEEDAHRDGFSSLEHLYGDFARRIYPEMLHEDWVTVYHLRIVTG